jgi:hypothetical protein
MRCHTKSQIKQDQEGGATDLQIHKGRSDTVLVKKGTGYQSLFFCSFHGAVWMATLSSKEHAA